MGVIKFLRDISNLFNWNTDDNPTNEQTYMNAVKNWQETEKNLVDTILWQPTTTYSVGNIIKTPSLPSQYCLVCTTAGISGANEPVYSSPQVGNSVSDGSVTWKIAENLLMPNGIVSGKLYFDSDEEGISTEKPFIESTEGLLWKYCSFGWGGFGSGNALQGAALLLNYKYGFGVGGGFALEAHGIVGEQEKEVEFNGLPNGTLTWNGQTIQTSSDKRLKTDFADIPDNVLDAWGKIDWQQFKFISDKEVKGDNCRFHVGLVAQDVKDVCEENNVDILKYGILCHDADKDQWTVRYIEALCMEVAYLRKEIAELKAKKSEK